jgi:hypothetical protein
MFHIGGHISLPHSLMCQVLKSIMEKIGLEVWMILENVICTELKMEKYFISMPDDLRICMSKLSLCNHKPPIEVGRHNNIERNLRFCNLCNKKNLGDKYHYLFVCDHFKQIRRKFLPANCCKNPSVQISTFRTKHC